MAPKSSSNRGLGTPSLPSGSDCFLNILLNLLNSFKCRGEIQTDSAQLCGLCLVPRMDSHAASIYPAGVWCCMLSGSFKPYEPEISATIEASFQEGKAEATFTLQHGAYIIGFSAMRQFQSSDLSRSREVFRHGAASQLRAAALASAELERAQRYRQYQKAVDDGTVVVRQSRTCEHCGSSVMCIQDNTQLLLGYRDTHNRVPCACTDAEVHQCELCGASAPADGPDIIWNCVKFSRVICVICSDEGGSRTC